MPVVQTLDSAIHLINHYPADKYSIFNWLALSLSIFQTTEPRTLLCHGLWLVDFDLFCVFLSFKVRCLWSQLLWLMAAKTALKNIVKAPFELQSPRIFEQHSKQTALLTGTFTKPCVKYSHTNSVFIHSPRWPRTLSGFMILALFLSSYKSHSLLNLVF